jgi:glutamate racemase
LLRGLLERVAARLWRHPVALVDSAHAMARAVERELASKQLFSEGPGRLNCFVTDETRLAELGARFLGHPLDDVERVDLT